MTTAQLKIWIQQRLQDLDHEIQTATTDPEYYRLQGQETALEQILEEVIPQLENEE